MPLPLELWAEVFGYTDGICLGNLILVNRALGQEAERLLYRNVILRTRGSFHLFYQSIHACRRRAAIVTGIHISSLEDRADLDRIPSLLREFHNLRRLTLVLFEARLPQDHMSILQAILGVHFPSLSSFSIMSPLPLNDCFLNFLESHSHLQHLDLGSMQLLSGSDLSRFRYPPIRSLTCTSRLLAHLSPIVTSLTRLHIVSCSSSQLIRVAEQLGPQIVSLRLGSVYIPITTYAVNNDFASMSLYDVATRFPRLRFLQIDMGQVPEGPSC
ncbi:hypothetical protein BD310DRAFT_513297 [Dichomitus squalens]|uniref:F-box domain-containing protein n=1 Tax=Dichomitus squalens TaxID=114155 RepID=A0A4V2K7X7_9APHY|nr:hypothetical protein BD310DRAFT_513297 [Dichomitus squalens]